MNVQDRRRLLGPPNARPVAFSKVLEEPTEISNVSSNDKALPYMKMGLLTNCNGSSYIESGDDNLMLITSVYGPKPIRGSFTSKAVLTVHLENSIATANNSDGSTDDGKNFNTSDDYKDLSFFLKNIFDSVVQLDKYPKSGIDIFVKVVNTDSANTSNIPKLLQMCCNGILLGLVDANMEISDLVGIGIISHECCVSFIKNGLEMCGFWKMKDEDEQDIEEIVGKCKENYLENKYLISSYLNGD
ncbi:related to Exosome complex component MTR3 [Saccharomycodes ludwigii]|uniref:Related to Exosome complex component MTR3 n=1 Tax=Saccharomycodes ludwigii TaxID=36035 RepID=A0A376B5R3_9ASCO|nr:related to Exosome complex component MTR3 [Saccharomycodes ludwigii]